MIIDPRVQTELDSLKQQAIENLRASRPTPQRRCVYMGALGLQCETWFPAIDDNKLCPEHSKVVNPSYDGKPKQRFIDLQNEQRDYCYKFVDGTSQQQDMTLVFEFKDDEGGTKHDKLDRHIAFLERVMEDVRTRYFSTKAVKAQYLDEMTESERAERRKIKVISRPKEETARAKRPTIKSDPVRFMMQSQNLTEEEAKELVFGDPEKALIKKYMRKNNVSEETAKEQLGL